MVSLYPSIIFYYPLTLFQLPRGPIPLRSASIHSHPPQPRSRRPPKHRDRIRRPSSPRILDRNNHLHPLRRLTLTHGRYPTLMAILEQRLCRPVIAARQLQRSFHYRPDCDHGCLPEQYSSFGRRGVQYICAIRWGPGNGCAAGCFDYHHGSV